MAGTHEGFNLGVVRANFAQVEEARKATNALYAALGQVERRANNMHMNGNLPKEINHIDTVTASYIRRLESEGKTYEANQQKVKAYHSAIAELSNKQKELETALNRAATSADKNSDAYRTQQIKINQTVADINKFKAGMKSAQAEMDRIRPTGFNKIVHGATVATKATDTMKNKLHSAWNNIRGGATVAAAGIGAVGAAAMSGAKQSAEIQQRYREINNLAVLGGERQKEVTKAVSAMQREGRDISIKYGKSQQEVAAGYEDLVKRGYTTKQALGALTTEVQASVASGDKFSDVTTVSSQVLDAFGMRAKDTSTMLKNTKQVVNELAYSADATSTGFSDLGTAMSYVGTAAKANNISLAETSSALGVLSNNGLESDKAGTALRATINGLTNQINKIGTKNSIFTKLGIKKSEMLDAHGNLKGLSHDMGVLYQHIESHSKGGSDKNGFFKSIFGTSGMNGAMILAKSSKEVEDLTKRTEKAGKTGSYVAKLAAQNMGTAQGSAASAKQAMNAFKMTLGNALLPAINQASNALAKFLLSKDGKKFQKDVGGAVAKVANGLVKLIKWTATHKREVKWIGYGILAGYSISKGLKFILFLGQVKKGLEAIKAIKFVGGLFGKVTGGEKAAGTITKLGGALPKGRGGAGILTGALQSAKSAGGLKKLSTAGKLANGAAGVGVALDAGSQFVNAYKDRHNADKRSQDIGQGIGSAIGGGIGMYFGGPLGAAVGSQLGKVAGKWGGTAVNNFTKGWQKHKPPKRFWSMENLGWSTHNMFKNLPSALNKTGKRIKSWASGVGRNIHKGWDKGMKASHSFFKNLPKNMSQTGKALQRGWNQTWKKVNNNRYVKAFKQGEFIQTASKDIQSRWKSFSTDFGKKWNAGWKSFNNARYVKAFKKGEFFSTALKDIQSRWKSFSTAFGKKWNDFWGRLSKGWNNFWGKAGDIRKGITNNIKGFANSIAYGSGHSKHTFKYEKIKSHANGGAMHSTHGALVGESGPELAYKPYANHIRLLGINGPQFTKIQSGEHILNAHDTRKVLDGGLGHGMVLKGYANGTEKLAKTKKTVTSDYKQIADKSSKSLNGLSKKSKNTWSEIAQSTNKEASKTRKNVISHYSQMRTGAHKQMNAMHDGVIDLAKTTSKGFGKELGRMKGYAHDAMGGTISQVNKGISGIDKVLGQFGGNASVIKPVKFATGTDSNGRLTENTLAMVNDAKVGPRQEAIVTDKNELLFPRGQNTILPLKKGWGVLNGAQTQQVANSAGLRHFAKGSGISHSALKKLAEKAGANPAKSFKDMFLTHLKPGGTDLKRGTVGLANNSATHFGNPWSNAMWSVINNAIGGGAGKGGTREKFLKYAESTFSGVPYVMGAMSKAASDCSGMVAQALKHFGIDAGRSTVDMQHSSALQYLGKSLSRTIPGDLVIFGHGTGAAGHVGIVKNPKSGTMFNETPPHARVTRISDDMSMGYGFYRVKGLHNASTGKKTVKADKKLEALAKRELGPSALKWIKDKLGDEGALGGNIGGEGVKRWAGTVKRILGMLHLSTSSAMVNRVLRQINTESGGNPHARQPGADPDGDGSGPALGLMQTKRLTFEAYKRKGSGGIFNGPANIYAGLNYAKHRYGPSLSALGNGHGYAKGGKPAAHTPFIAGERGPELITADGPVKVDTHEQTKRKLSDLVNLVDPKINRPTHRNNSAPIININFNGPIGGSVEDAKRIAEIVKREITQYLVNIGDEFGTDPSLY
ncbi:phage tail tape measure protein [Lactobacillus sp. A27]|uniref:phage tail tape measure protein n=1 Tax=Lactobacillus sp. A27 TaxID=2796363 RepID=UPI00191D9A5A|nr:phage tail tape measure protein [Lactobacillus sp. A27]MBL1059514.1 phage tail tape measure protein [Lactobacillus sp. A27]